ncbi:MAG: NBR1-Ig-like domain-containing protein [Archangium sp.]
MRHLLAILSFCTLSACIDGTFHVDGNDESTGAPAPAPTPVTPPAEGAPDSGTTTLPPVEVDDAAVVSATLPSALACGERLVAQVVMKNTGTSTWTRSGGVKLGAAGDSDPLSAVGRLELDVTERVAPGQTRIFSITLDAPRAMASLTTDWRMVREGVAWFGETKSQLVQVAACNEDAIDLSQVEVFNSPSDVAGWAITTHIERLEMHPEGDIGLVFSFPAQQTWPDYTPPGWDGPLQYTVWAVLKINGRWVTSGYIQMWNGRYGTGAPLLTDFARNWAYDGRWGPMMGYNPQVGEQVGFFVTAGNARGIGEVTSLRERSNVVTVNLPAGDTGTFNF